MERTAIRRRLSWQVATVAAIRQETATARTLVLEIPDWPGHLAGQHVDVRLTAPDGYRASRSYSIASAWTGSGIELTIQLVPDGEVSPYLVEMIKPGDPVELRGPVGGWFVWHPDHPGPVQLIAGGSGIVPLRAILQAHQQNSRGVAPIRLLYSVRQPDTVIYAGELAALGVTTFAYTRQAPAGERAGRIDADLLDATTFAPADHPTTYVCGPTPFVEAVADLLVAAGHDPGAVRTERFGGR